MPNGDKKAHGAAAAAITAMQAEAAGHLECGQRGQREGGTSGQERVQSRAAWMTGKAEILF